MQHGTGRELVADEVENVLAVLEDIRARFAHPYGTAESIAALRRVLEVLEGTDDLDETGVYGPDYGTRGRPTLTEGAFTLRGSIRDSRPEGLGR